MLVQIVHAVQMFAAYSMLLLFFSVGSLLKSAPAFRNFIIGAFDAVTKVKLPVTTYWESLFTDRMFQNVWHSVALDLNKKIKQGSEAPNSPVVSMTGKHCFPLLQMSKSGRPLVLNFGSCTCPIFMSQLDEFQKMGNHFSHIADFCVVYIEEAHPSDGWALKVSYFNVYFYKIGIKTIIFMVHQYRVWSYAFEVIPLTLCIRDNNTFQCFY